MKLIQQLQQQPDVNNKYQRQNDILTKKGKLVIGSVLDTISIILDWLHSYPQGGHFGVKATEKRVKALIY